MRGLRRFVYRLGFRPSRLNPLYSPSLNMAYALKDGIDQGLRDAPYIDPSISKALDTSTLKEQLDEH